MKKKIEIENEANNPYDFYFWIGAEAEQLTSLERNEFIKRVEKEATRETSGRKPLPEV